MANSPLKNKLGIAPQQDDQQVDPRLNELVSQAVSLARDTRFTDGANDEPLLFQDFARTIRTSGRMLLVSDGIALVLAFIIGGLAARAINMYLLSGGFQELTSAYTLQEFFTILGLG